MRADLWTGIGYSKKFFTYSSIKLLSTTVSLNEAVLLSRETVTHRRCFKNSPLSRKTSSPLGAATQGRKWPRRLLLSLIGGATILAALFQYQKYKWRQMSSEIFYLPHKYAMFNLIPYAKYKNTVVSVGMFHHLAYLPTFHVREDDVFVITFPRSGTTWTQEIVYLIMNDVDISKATSQNLEKRFPYLEDVFSSHKLLVNKPSPRLIKTHLPVHLLPGQIWTVKPKIIYVARNPKDAIVSHFHLMMCMRNRFMGSIDEYAQLFLEDKVIFCPWHKHVLAYWEQRNEDNVLFIKYEHLKMDFRGTVKKIGSHLGRHLSEEQITRIETHCTFANMKSNRMVNYSWWDWTITKDMGNSFIRKGEVGDWRTHFSPEVTERLDAYVTSHLAGSGLSFDEPNNDK